MSQVSCTLIFDGFERSTLDINLLKINVASDLNAMQGMGSDSTEMPAASKSVTLFTMTGVHPHCCWISDGVA